MHVLRAAQQPQPASQPPLTFPAARGSFPARPKRWAGAQPARSPAERELPGAAASAGLIGAVPALALSRWWGMPVRYIHRQTAQYRNQLAPAQAARKPTHVCTQRGPKRGHQCTACRKGGTGGHAGLARIVTPAPAAAITCTRACVSAAALPGAAGCRAAGRGKGGLVSCGFGLHNSWLQPRCWHAKPALPSQEACVEAMQGPPT